MKMNMEITDDTFSQLPADPIGVRVPGPTMANSNPSMISEILQSLANREEADAAFILAATINLYSESIRRRAGRILYGPEDAKELLRMVNVLLDAKPMAASSFLPSNKPTEPTSEEREVIMDPTEMRRRV